MTSWPCSASSPATTELSTPPDIATRTRILPRPVQPLLPETLLQPRGLGKGGAQDGEAGIAAMADAQRVNARGIGPGERLVALGGVCVDPALVGIAVRPAVRVGHDA